MYTIENNLLHLQLGDQPSRDFCTIQASLPPAAAASKAATAHCIIVSYCQMMAMVIAGRPLYGAGI